MTVHANRGARADMNVTPLIDVLLVLLIIFMVTVPIDSVGLNALIPQPADRSGGDGRPIVVEIDEDLRITVNKEPQRLEDLGGRLAQVFLTRAEKVVFVKAAPNLEFENVANVIDVVKGAGIEHIGLLISK